MKVYQVNMISGYWLGQFEYPHWTTDEPTIQSTVCPDLRGIERDVLVAYWNYLWRLGEYTFGATYGMRKAPAGGAIELQRFAEYYLLQLWPEYGRLWGAVGATEGWFDGIGVMDLTVALKPVDVEGWYWDPVHNYWEQRDMPTEKQWVTPERPPMPTEPPRPAQPLDVPGWYWNGRAGVWEPLPMPAELKLVTPERPPEPSELPSRTQPAEVLGWRYSFMYKVWEKIPIDQVWVEVEKERPPMPEYMPGVEAPLAVEGWSWSTTTEEWVETPMVPVEIEVAKERPPKPLAPPGFHEPTSVTRASQGYDIIFRYRERLWWAKLAYTTLEGKSVYRDAYEIPYSLMFELRGTGVAKKNEDEWNFGMAWWERIMVDGQPNWYLWAEADVTYLGFGVRIGPDLLVLQERKY